MINELSISLDKVSLFPGEVGIEGVGLFNSYDYAIKLRFASSFLEKKHLPC